MRRDLGRSALLAALVILVCIASSEALGTCSSAHPKAPKSSLSTKSTASSLTGTRLRVSPRIPQTKEIVSKYYIDAEVFMLREMEPASQCIKSSDVNSLNLPYLQQVNTSECNCTHTPGFDFFPGTTVRRDYVKVEFTCANIGALALSLDVNIVNASHAVEHTAAMGPNATTYDYYTYVNLEGRKSGCQKWCHCEMGPPLAITLSRLHHDILMHLGGNTPLYCF